MTTGELVMICALFAAGAVLSVIAWRMTSPAGTRRPRQRVRVELRNRRRPGRR